MKKLVIFVFTILSILGGLLYSFDSHATDEYVSIFIDCGGLNSCRVEAGFDLINGEDRAKIGSTVSSVWNLVEDPTSVDQDFIGWYI